MAIYESMVIFSGRLEANEVDAEMEKIKNLIESGDGSLHSVERMGKRRLAYEIRKEWDGHYFVLHFEDSPSRVAGLQRSFRLNEAVLRHMVFRKDSLPDGPTVGLEEDHGHPRRDEEHAAPPAPKAEKAPAGDPPVVVKASEEAPAAEPGHGEGVAEETKKPEVETE
ncbi:MAG: 30S ribosomal protein S6 [Candidatus Eisenbacteria bacterium]